MDVHDTDGGARWYAIHTNPKQEDRVDSNLRAWRVETFAPRIKERQYTRAGEAKYRFKPLFPQYIFARFDAERMLHKIGFTRGVHCVVSFGSDPTPVDDEIIAFIQAQVGEDGYIDLSERFKAGDQVIIKGGPLKDFVGIFEREIKESERVVILLTTLKYQGRVLLDRDFVKKIN